MLLVVSQRMRRRPGFLRAAALLAWGVALAGLGIALFVGSQAYAEQRPGAAGSSVVRDVAVLSIGLTFVAWPALVLLGLRHRRMWAVALPPVGYAAEAWLGRFSIGEFHLLFLAPVLALAALLGSLGLRSRRPAVSRGETESSRP